MDAAVLYRGAGLAGILAGALNIIAEFLPARLGLPLDMLANVLGLWVLAALYLGQRAQTGRIGFVGYVLQSFGLAVVVGFLFTDAFVLSALDPAQRAAALAGPAGLAAVAALALATIGAVLFGIATLRAGVFPRWAAALLMAGFVIVPAAAVAPALVKTVGELVLSAGLIGLSLSLFNAPPPAGRAAHAR
jgi:hypothetical protein